MYDDHIVCYIQHKVSVWKAETEVMDNKTGVATGKVSVVNNNHSEEIQALVKKIPPLCLGLKAFRVMGEDKLAGTF